MAILQDIQDLLSSLTGASKRLNDSLFYTSEHVSNARDLVEQLGKTAKLTGKEIEAVTGKLDEFARTKVKTSFFAELNENASDHTELLTRMEQSWDQVLKKQEKYRLQAERLNAAHDYFGTAAGFAGVTALLFGGMEETTKHTAVLQRMQYVSGADDLAMARLNETVQRADHDLQAANVASYLNDYGFSIPVIDAKLPYVLENGSALEYAKNIPQDQGLKQIIELATSLRVQDYEFDHFMDTATKAMILQSGTVQAFQETAKYIGREGQPYGVTEQQTLELAILANDAGWGGDKNGKPIADFMMKSLPAMLDQKSEAYRKLAEYKLVDEQGQSKYFSGGKVTDLPGLFEAIGKLKFASEQEKSSFYNSLFKENRGMAELFAEMISNGKMTEVRSKLANMPSPAAMDQGFSESEYGQVKKFQDNMRNLRQNLQLGMMNAFEWIAGYLNKGLAMLNNLLVDHPNLAKWIGGIAASLAILGATVFSVMAVWKVAAFALMPFVNGIKLLGSVLMKPINKIRNKKGKNGGDENGNDDSDDDCCEKDGKNNKRKSNKKKAGGETNDGFLKKMGTWVKDAGSKLFKGGGWKTAAAIGGKTLLRAVPVVGTVMTGIDLATSAYSLWQNRDTIKDTVTGFFKPKAANSKKNPIAEQIGKYTDDARKLVPKKMEEVGGFTMDGLLKGIRDRMPSLQGVMSTVSDLLQFTFRRKMAIHSPSRVMMENGKFITEGLAAGIVRNTDMVKSASLKLASQVKGPGRNALASGLQSRNQGLAGAGDVHIHVHPHPHQRSEDIANDVMRKLGAAQRHQMMNTGFRVNDGGF